MIEKDKIKTLVEEIITENQFLIEVKVSSDNVIQVMVDGDSGISINDCVNISRHIEGNLDREQEDFELSVFSAGLGEPFKLPRQFKKNEGKEVEVLLKNGIKHKGILDHADEKGFNLSVIIKEKVEGKKKKQLITQTYHFDYEEIKETKNIIKF